MRDVEAIRTGILAAVHQGLSIDEGWTHWEEGAVKIP